MMDYRIACLCSSDGIDGKHDVTNRIDNRLKQFIKRIRRQSPHKSTLSIWTEDLLDNTVDHPWNKDWRPYCWWWFQTIAPLFSVKFAKWTKESNWSEYLNKIVFNHFKGIQWHFQCAPVQSEYSTLFLTHYIYSRRQREVLSITAKALNPFGNWPVPLCDAQRANTGEKKDTKIPPRVC